MAINLRRGRLGIPRVNQNPQPPNAHRIVRQPRQVMRRQSNQRVNKLANAMLDANSPHTAAPAAPTAPPTTQAVPQTPAPTPASQPIPGLQPGSLQAALASGQQIEPGQLFQFSSFTPSPGQPDPRDSNYWRNLSSLLFNSTQQYQQGLAAQTNANVDYQREQEQGATNRGLQQRSTAEQAIAQGLGHSGYLDRTDAQQTGDYLNAVEGQRLAKTRGDQSRQLDLANILSGFTQQEGDLLQNAGDAYAANQERLANQGAPETSQSDVNASAAAIQRARQHQKAKDAKRAKKKGKK